MHLVNQSFTYQFDTSYTRDNGVYSDPTVRDDDPTTRDCESKDYSKGTCRSKQEPRNIIPFINQDRRKEASNGCDIERREDFNVNDSYLDNLKGI